MKAMGYTCERLAGAYLAKVIIVVGLQNALVRRWKGVWVDKLVSDSVSNGAHDLGHALLICSRHTAPKDSSCMHTARLQKMRCSGLQCTGQ